MRPDLSENPGVHGTQQPAFSDKAHLCKWGCRKNSELPTNIPAHIPTKSLLANCFVGKTTCSQRKTARQFRQTALSRPVLSENHRTLCSHPGSFSSQSQSPARSLSENPDFSKISIYRVALICQKRKFFEHFFKKNHHNPELTPLIGLGYLIQR